MQYPHGTILNSNSDSTYKKLPENIYFFGVPNILPEPDPGRLCKICNKYIIKEIASSFQVHRKFLQYIYDKILLCTIFFQTESIYVSNDNLWDEDLFPIFLCILVPLYIAKKKMLHFFFLLLYTQTSI